MNTDKVLNVDLLGNPIIAKLGKCTDINELGDLVQESCDSMGVARYAIVRFVGIGSPRIAQILHNADDNGTAYIEDAAALSSWRAIQEVRRYGRPMTFGQVSAEPGPDGFARGVAALARKSRSNCITVLGCEGQDFDDDMGALLMSAAMLMASCVHDSLEAIHVNSCPFTRQELACLMHAMAGESAKETARTLDLGVRTVEEYLTRARKRLGVQSTMAACITAIDHGWISLDQVRKIAA